MDRTDEQQVMQWFIDFEAATKRGDRPALERLVADEYTLVNPDGSIANKDGMINQAASPGITFDEVVRTIHSVRVAGETAEAVSTFTMRGSYGRRQVNGTFHDTKTFVKREGGWQMVSDRITRINEITAIQ